jgi:hypothetical protein
MAVITSQSGLREYTGNINDYSGMISGLAPDIHTLKSLNPETTNRVRIFMYRGPFFLMQYLAGSSKNAYGNNIFSTYKKLIEYYNMGFRPTKNGGQLQQGSLQGGFAGRNIAIPTTQTSGNNESLQITIPELVGRPATTVHNMWIDGISDRMTGLTTYFGLVAGSGSVTSEGNTLKRVFKPAEGESNLALEPSPAYEVAEFLIVVLDRSGARVEAATAALGCYPQGRVGDDLFEHNNNGQSNIQQLTLTYNCQFVESSYVNDFAARVVAQQSIFGSYMNLNPGFGDAMFTDTSQTSINTPQFNGGNRPSLDAVQSGVGNYPAFKASQQVTQRDGLHDHTIEPIDHSQIYKSGNPGDTADIGSPYSGAGEG